MTPDNRISPVGKEIADGKYARRTLVAGHALAIDSAFALKFLQWRERDRNNARRQALHIVGPTDSPIRVRDVRGELVALEYKDVLGDFGIADFEMIFPEYHIEIGRYKIDTGWSHDPGRGGRGIRLSIESADVLRHLQEINGRSSFWLRDGLRAIAAVRARQSAVGGATA